MKAYQTTFSRESRPCLGRECRVFHTSAPMFQTTEMAKEVLFKLQLGRLGGVVRQNVHALRCRKTASVLHTLKCTLIPVSEMTTCAAFRQLIAAQVRISQM